MTNKHRLIFRPIEKLQIQKIGSVAIEEVPLDDRLDCQFKPGLYRQVEAFLRNVRGILPDVQQQVSMLSYYEMINKVAEDRDEHGNKRL